MKTLILTVVLAVVSFAALARSDIGFAGVYVGDNTSTWPKEKMQALKALFHGEPIMNGHKYREMWVYGKGYDEGGCKSVCCTVDEAGYIVAIELTYALDRKMSLREVKPILLGVNDKWKRILADAPKSNAENDVVAGIKLDEDAENSSSFLDYSVILCRRGIEKDIYEGRKIAPCSAMP